MNLKQKRNICKSGSPINAISPLNENPIRLEHGQIIEKQGAKVIVISDSHNPGKFFLLDHKTCKDIIFSLRAFVGSSTQATLPREELFAITEDMDKLVDFFHQPSNIFSFTKIESENLTDSLVRCICSALHFNPSLFSKLVGHDEYGNPSHQIKYRKEVPEHMLSTKASGGEILASIRDLIIQNPGISNEQLYYELSDTYPANNISSNSIRCYVRNAILTYPELIELRKNSSSGALSVKNSI